MVVVTVVAAVIGAVFPVLIVIAVVVLRRSHLFVTSFLRFLFLVHLTIHSQVVITTDKGTPGHSFEQIIQRLVRVFVLEAVGSLLEIVSARLQERADEYEPIE